MGLLNVIRRLRLRQGLPIREIERRTGLSRNTIKKYLNEPPRVCRRLISVSYAAMGSVSRVA